MNYYEEILTLYHHLLMLDSKEDKEKRWITDYEPKAKNLSTVHFHILSYLLKQPNSLAREISDNLSVLPGTLSKRLALLIERDFVEASKDEIDGRGKRYRLTTNGERLAQIHGKLLSTKNQQLAQELKGFTSEELQTIVRFLYAFKKAEETINYPSEFTE